MPAHGTTARDTPAMRLFTDLPVEQAHWVSNYENVQPARNTGFSGYGEDAHAEATRLFVELPHGCIDNVSSGGSATQATDKEPTMRELRSLIDRQQRKER